MSKKVFHYLSFLIVLGSFCFISCNQDEVNNSKVRQAEESEEIDDAFEDLTSQLEIYDSRFYTENSIQTDTRGFWRWLLRVCKADVVGAAVGAGTFKNDIIN